MNFAGWMRMMIVPLFACITPHAVVGGPPVPESFGRVLDAATAKPVAGVRVVAIDAGSPSEGVGPRVVEATTDSVGNYMLSIWGKAWVAYMGVDYQSIRLVFPDDLVDVECESCCGRVKDVKMWRSH